MLPLCYAAPPILYMQPLGPYSWTLWGDFILESIKDRIADVTPQRLEGARTINN